MKIILKLLCLLLAVGSGLPRTHAASSMPTNPVVFVTQVPISKESNANVSNTFLSVVSLFSNHTADTARAGRGGDLWLRYTNGALLNLTRAGHFGLSGAQHTNGIAVRDPHIHWSGGRVLFSMVAGAPASSSDASQFYWQLYELTNLTAVIANSNTVPAIVPVLNQPTNCHNVSPCYATDDRIIFTSDRPLNGARYLYPTREEYKGHPTVTGTWSLDPANNDLRLLQHTPSGAFNPFIDSFGRLIVTRWDHLVQDSNATDDRLRRATNGAFNFATEAQNAATSTNILESFPEPRNFDTNGLAASGTRGMAFNQFLPWMLSQIGGGEELLNHVGRHELNQSVLGTFTNDANLISFTNPATRSAFGIKSANTNYFLNFVQIAEDPRNPGVYFGVDAPDFSAAGGTHSAGQIITLTGPPTMNPTQIVVAYITPKSTAAPNALGVYRNPLPMSDGSLVAAFTPAANVDSNLGSTTFPNPLYHFRLMTLTNTGASWTTNKFLTGGITNPAIYWDGSNLVTYTGALWELQPVEVRAPRNPPQPWLPGVAPIEQQVFAEEGVDLPTFQADLQARELALVVSRNVTARDAADKQQPYNLRIPGGVQTLGTNSGRIYDITHLQFLQADYRRGYGNTPGTTNMLPGRRVLATPMHDAMSFNLPSSKTNAPAGGIELMSDGSQATFVPANRAVTWQFTGTTNESLVKERFWVTFRPGEVRTCANCHGINATDQVGRPSPTNAPLALRELLRFWKINAANAYQLTVTNGSGSGGHGAGTILSLSANPPPSGQVFAQWTGAAVSNAASPTTFFVMPPSNAVVTATYQPAPPPNHPPVAYPQSLAVTQNTPQPITLGGHDLDNDPLTFAITVPPTQGTLSGALPNLTFTPSNNVTGPDFFFFTVSDGKAISAPAVVNVGINSPTNPPPVIALFTPTNHTWFIGPTNIVIAANASDADGIARVDFYDSTNRLATLTNAPYSFTWTNPLPGNYTLVAKAFDNPGARSFSAPVVISVLGATPQLLIQPQGANQMMISWPLALTGFLLEAAGNPAGPWTLVPQPIVDTATQHTVIVPMPAQEFYRLVQDY